jgi:hypothetical protein
LSAQYTTGSRSSESAIDSCSWPICGCPVDATAPRTLKCPMKIGTAPPTRADGELVRELHEDDVEQLHGACR